jgi:hypothetical protein
MVHGSVSKTQGKRCAGEDFVTLGLVQEDACLPDVH